MLYLQCVIFDNVVCEMCNMRNFLLILFLFFISCTTPNYDVPDQKNPNYVPPAPPEESENEDGSLNGTIIGTTYSVDYNNGNSSSQTVNTKSNVFDRNFDTFFASYERSNTWVGLDLGKKYVITRVGYAPRTGYGSRVELAIIEGANKADFSDAIPIYMIKQAGKDSQMTYADVKCSRGFRYVRYVTPNDVRCNLAELAFFGKEGEGDDSQLYQVTNLPTVVINTSGGKEINSKENEVISNVYIISDDGKKILVGESAGVRGRGNASWNFPKKPYRIKFDKKCRILDAPAEAKKWTLISNYGDKTLMRNMVAFEISRRLGMAYTPYAQPVDVIVNGEYRGCYQLCDQIDVKNGRVDITETKKNESSIISRAGGYLVEIDAYYSSEKCYFISNRGVPVVIKSPDEDIITSEHKQYITDYFNSLEGAIFASNFDDERAGYRKYLDLPSFLKHFVVGELSGNTDTYWSVYMSKDRNSDKFHVGPVWDFDLAFDNDVRTYPVNNLNDFVYASRGSVASETVRNMVNRIVKQDIRARSDLNTMWQWARGSVLTAESLNAYVDEKAAEMNESQQLNFKRWPILDKLVHENHQALGSYQAEVDFLKRYITNRFPKMDMLIGGK